MSLLLRTADTLLDGGQDIVKNIPVVGNVLKDYLGNVKQYIDTNAAYSVRHPNGIPEQKFEDIPVYNIFENAAGKKYAPGSLGPRTLKSIEMEKKINKMANKPNGRIPHRSEITPKQITDFLPVSLPPAPIQAFTQRDYDIMLSNYPKNLNPVIKVEFSTRPDANYDFPALQNENPNAAFATSGFTKVAPRAGRNKIYKVVI